jgi:hypothetical protein
MVDGAEDGFPRHLTQLRDDDPITLLWGGELKGEVETRVTLVDFLLPSVPGEKFLSWIRRCSDWGMNGIVP